MTAFAYNNSVHLNIDRALNELFKNYVADFANESENRLIKKETFLIIERAKWLRSSKEYSRNLWKKVTKRQKLSYDTFHKAIVFSENDKVLLQNINIHTLRFKKNWSSSAEILYYY